MKKIMPIAVLATAFATTSIIPVHAQQTTSGQPALHLTQVKSETAAMTEGEVRRIDKEAQKITLRHGPIQNLGMPSMTMVFQVKDVALLDKVKTGDKVRFHAEKISGGYQVTEIEAVR